MSQLPELILASTSVFRAKVLEDAGFQFSVMAPQVDETSIVGQNPRDIALQRALAKGRDVAGRLRAEGRANWVAIGCDQTLGLGNLCFDKARDASEALEHLRLLSGRKHHLHSAFVLVSEVAGAATEHADVVSVSIAFRQLSEQEIARHVATGEWRGSVGAYKIEGHGAGLMTQVPTDKSAVIGLPLTAIVPILRVLGVKPTYDVR